MSEFAAWVSISGISVLVLIIWRNSRQDELYREKQGDLWLELKKSCNAAETQSKEFLSHKLALNLKVKDLAETVSQTLAKVQEMDRRNNEVFMKMREFGVMIQEIDNELEKKILIHERETQKKLDWLAKVYASYYDLKREKVLKTVKLKKEASA